MPIFILRIKKKLEYDKASMQKSLLLNKYGDISTFQ